MDDDALLLDTVDTSFVGVIDAGYAPLRRDRVGLSWPPAAAGL